MSSGVMDVGSVRLNNAWTVGVDVVQGWASGSTYAKEGGFFHVWGFRDDLEYFGAMAAMGLTAERWPTIEGERARILARLHDNDHSAPLHPSWTTQGIVQGFTPRRAMAERLLSDPAWAAAAEATLRPRRDGWVTLVAKPGSWYICAICGRQGREHTADERKSCGLSSATDAE